MSEQKKDFLKENFTYTFLLGVCKGLMAIIMPVKFHGQDNLPEEAPYVLISNHNSLVDPVAMAAGVKKYQICFMGKKELGNNKLFAKLLTKLHCFLVDRHKGDMEAMRTATRVLREGHVLGIFPEGTRHHQGQMEELESGTALLTMRSGAPLVPVYFDRKLRFFHRTHVYYGKPMDYSDLRAEGINTETCEKLTERIRETYREWQAEVPFKE